jgi:hypothetical protein
MKNLLRAAALAAAVLSPPLQGSEIEAERARMESLTRGLAQGEAIELRALEIRAKIYEPSVIYILDRAKLEVDYTEQPIRFKAKCLEPILENRF